MNDKSNTKILKLLDEILNKSKQNKELPEDLKNRINSLENEEFLEFIKLYSSIKEYEESTEKKQVPEFYIFRIQDYYNKQKILWDEEKNRKSLPQVVIRFIKNQFELIQNSLPELQFATEAIQMNRSNETLKKEKMIWQETIDNSKKIEYTLIPQENSFLLSINLTNFQGPLTLKLKKDRAIIDIKHFTNIKGQDWILLDNLTFGDYYLYFKGAYNKEYHLKIVN
ncbi:MAG: hypothetical protein ACK4UJ_05870 [Leptonema sp. (in: bacteria)]